MVFGLDASDDPAIAADFVKENGGTFPVVLDNSDAVCKIQFSVYQTLAGMSAVPLNYLID